MKYNKNKINIMVLNLCLSFIIISFLPLFVSCDDELSALPKQSKVDGTLVVDEQSALVALRGIYYSYAMCGSDNNGIQSTQCSRQYEIRPADFAGTIIYTWGAYQLETHNPESMKLANAWQSLYTVVNATNCVIDEITETSDNLFSGNRKAEMLGEARCMRAYADYNLLRYYGYYWDINSPYGIIIRNTHSTVTHLPAPRNTVKETYDQILSDLDFAIEHAPAQNEKFFATKWLAMGLKIRVLMMRGQDSDYSDAAALANNIINSGNYTLEEDVVDVFQTKGLNSSEVIFGVKPKDNQSDVFLSYYMMSYPSYAPQYLATENLLKLFEGDPRLERQFYPNQKSSMVFHPDGTMETVYTTVYGVNKHLVPGVFAASEIEENQIHMRLTEMYLLRAEALTRLNQLDEARQLLRIVQTHAGYTDFSQIENARSQHEMLQQVFNEYLRSLFCESGREVDIMMRYPEDIVLAFNPAYANKQYSVFPLPVEEFMYNNKLSAEDQNPGYGIE